MSKHTRGIDMSNDKNQAVVADKNAKAATVEPGTPVPLDQIHVDFAWNCRAERRVQDVSDSESTGFEGFGANIRETGQITPVILRHTHGKTLSGQKTDLPYELVVGFRRMRAIRILNDKNEAEKAKAENRNNVPNLPNGTILASVREISDATQARLLNGQENILRANLKAPDLVFLLRDLAKTGITQTALGQSLGITQSWVSKLLAIASLPAPIVDNWRTGSPIPTVTTKDGTFSIKAGETTKELTEPDMRSLAGLKCTPEELTARYIRMVRPPVTQGDGEGAPNTGVDKVLENVREIAALMGCMVRAGVLENGSLDWNRVIGLKKKGYPIDCGKDDSQQRLIDLGDAAQEAFEHEVSRGAKGMVEKPRDGTSVNN